MDEAEIKYSEQDDDELQRIYRRISLRYRSLQAMLMSLELTSPNNRLTWSYIRFDNFWNEAVTLWRNDQKYGDFQLRKDLRVSFTVFDMLCNAIRDHIDGLSDSSRCEFDQEYSVSGCREYI